ncbi:MAG: hypothetical protein HWE08_01930 [Alphaproteobacteria bacterium]|nr:hypothetical protein [Alphaproteobacteria bacterium]
MMRLIAILGLSVTTSSTFWFIVTRKPNHQTRRIIALFLGNELSKFPEFRNLKIAFGALFVICDQAQAIFAKQITFSAFRSVPRIIPLLSGVINYRPAFGCARNA